MRCPSVLVIGVVSGAAAATASMVCAWRIARTELPKSSSTAVGAAGAACSQRQCHCQAGKVKLCILLMLFIVLFLITVA